MPLTPDAITARAATAETITQIIKTVASSGTPEALAATATYFRKATIIAKKAGRTPNGGIVYLGVTSTNDTQPFALAIDQVIQINAVAGTALNLANFYLDVATNGDGVIIWYS